MVRPRTWFLVAVGALGAPACSRFGSRTVFQAVAVCPSPDGRYAATFFRQSGGGAAGWALGGVQLHRADTVAAEARRPAFAAYQSWTGHVYWSGPREVTVEYPAVASVRLLEGVAALPDTVWIVPRPVRGMEHDLSDVPECAPYRPSWERRAPGV
ncbi:hypothetical protein tb265_41370 [Gemmatimonadetes bacterium T265]|nr:hypothetical protein tb265_41370 [Gemmatimonadetes bacterium T265]